ncbi:MAG: hypothetical protein IJ894_03380, partial [Bacteroidales bacterium]|nr:hypothetical protein [Bacteroidales bacterium]
MAILNQFHSGTTESATLNQNVCANPERENVNFGKSVRIALLPNERYWFPIRATHHRAQQIYDKLVSLKDDNLEPYLPILRHVEYTNEDFNNPTQYIADKPLDTGLLFLRSTLNDFRALLQYRKMLAGMTPIIIIFPPIPTEPTTSSPSRKGRWRVLRLSWNLVTRISSLTRLSF